MTGIKYDGAVFPNVESLIAYKKAMGELNGKDKENGKDEPKPIARPLSPPVTPAPAKKPFVPYRKKKKPNNYGTSYTQEEVQNIWDAHLPMLKANGRLQTGSLGKLSHQFGRTKDTIGWILWMKRKGKQINYGTEAQYTKGHWSEQEEAKLKEIIDTRTLPDGRLENGAITELAKDLNRRYKNVEHKISKMRKKASDPPKKYSTTKQHKWSAWTNEEDNYLKAHLIKYANKKPRVNTVKKLARKLKRTTASVHTRLWTFKHQIAKGDMPPPEKETPKWQYKIDPRSKWEESQLLLLKTIVEESQLPSGTTPVHVMDNLVKQFGKSKKNISNKIFKLKKQGQIHKPHHPPMIKKSPLVPDDYTTAMTKEAQKSSKEETQRKGTVTDAELDFPHIFPLDEKSTPILEKLVVDMIGQKGSINYFTARATLQLKEGYDWSGIMWRNFCEQFAMSIPKIAKALLCEQKRLKVVVENGYHSITYR